MKRTPQQMADALSQLFLNCEDLMTDEEIDAALREFGYDPDELGRKFKTLVDKLIDHAYDSGYYSGQKLDGQPLHGQAIHSRNNARRRIIEVFVKVCNECDALRQELHEQQSAPPHCHSSRPTV